MDPDDRRFSGDAAAVQDVDHPVSCGPPNIEDTRRAVKQLNSGKAPRAWGIYADIFERE